jgi:DHA1 family tetracycline resistance protein-like MFS transporter
VNANVASSTQRRKPAVVFILVCVLIDVLGFGLIIPVLPSLVGEFAGTRDAQAYWYGVLTVIYGVMQFVCAPLLGALSDRYGRRPVMLFAITGLGVDFLLQALSPSLTWLLIARLIGGGTAANFSVASAYIADVTEPDERSKAMGLIGAAFGVGFIIGPVLGGLLAGVNLRLPFYVAAGLAFVNVLYGLLILPESLPKDRRAPFPIAKANPFSALKKKAQMRSICGLLWVFAFTVLAQFMLQTTWALFTTFRFDWTPRDIGISLFVVGLTAALMQGVLLGRVLKRFGDRRTATYGLISGAIAYTLYAVALDGWMMYVIIAANALSFAGGPALQGLISKNVDPRAQGLTMGSLKSLQSILMVIAPLITTPLLAWTSHFPRDDLRVGAPFFVGAALQLIATALAIRHFRRHPIDAPEIMPATSEAA